MSATIVQKLKVIAENKMRSDSATAKIILEAAQIIENKNFKSHSNKADNNEGGEVIYRVGLGVDMCCACLFSNLGRKKIKNIAKLFNCEILNFEVIAYYMVRFEVRSKREKDILEYCECLYDNRFSVNSFKI